MLLTPGSSAWLLRALVGWDAMALTLLTLCWRILWTSGAGETERRADVEDPGRVVVFVLVVVSALVSLFASALVLRLMRGHEGEGLWATVTLISVALSWLVTHTIYTLRYAHLYYAGNSDGGLTFPGTDKPCDMDFAYYAFTVGMCFQVSDVQITAPNIRRATLGHALISFLFNTTIVALALNVVFQLLG